MTEENVTRTEHPKIFINKITGRSAEDLRLALERLKVLSGNGHEHELRLYLNQLLPKANLNLSAHLCGNEDNNVLKGEARVAAAASNRPDDLPSSVPIPKHSSPTRSLV